MKLSIIVPTKNRAQSLKDVVNCLFPQLGVKDEIIIVDNNSTDNTKEFISNLKENRHFSNIIYMKETRSGPSYARNLGIKCSSGDIVAFLDDDCMVNDYWVRNIKKFFSLKGNKNIILQGAINHTTNHENLFHRVLIFQNQYIKDLLMKDNAEQYINYINAGNFVCSKIVIKRYKKFFDEKNFPYICEEKELAQRLNFDGYIIKLTNDLLVNHRKIDMPLINRMKSNFQYGYYSGKIEKKFKSDNSIIDIFKLEIKRKYKRDILSEISHISSQFKDNTIELVSVFIYLLIKEIIFKIGFIFGKNAEIKSY